MKFFEQAAERYLKRRGRIVLPIGFRGFAIGGPGTYALCQDYSNKRPSQFTVILEAHSQLIAINHSIITCPIDRSVDPIDMSVDMSGASA